MGAIGEKSHIQGHEGYKEVFFNLKFGMRFNAFMVLKYKRSGQTHLLFPSPFRHSLSSIYSSGSFS